MFSIDQYEFVGDETCVIPRIEAGWYVTTVIWDGKTGDWSWHVGKCAAHIYLFSAGLHHSPTPPIG